MGMSVQYSSFFQMAMGLAMAMEMAHTMGTNASMARMPTALRCGCTISYGGKGPYTYDVRLDLQKKKTRRRYVACILRVRG